MENAFALSTEQVLARFGVDSSRGLTDAQVRDQQAKHGSNCTFSGHIGRTVSPPPRLRATLALSLSLTVPQPSRKTRPRRCGS